MSRNLKILPIVAALLVMAVFGALLIISLLTQTQFGVFPFRRQTLPNPADLELYYLARTVFSTINIALLIVLMITYASIYRKTKSEFTIGLVLFAAFFLVKELTWSPFVIGIMGFGLYGLGPFAFLPDVFECIALSVLLYLSIKY